MIQYSRNELNKQKVIRTEDLVDLIYSVYNNVPDQELSFEELKKIVVNRLSLLKKIELLSENAQLDESNQSRQQLDDKIVKQLQNFDLKLNIYEQSQSNSHNIGHYLLKLAYSQSEDTKNWLIRHETMLFQALLKTYLQQSQQQQLLNKLGISYEKVSSQEWMELKTQIIAGASWSEKQYREMESLSQNDFYRVPFKDALEMVSRMTVFVKKGIAYVPKTCLQEIVGKVFRDQLRESLNFFQMHRATAISFNERIKNLLNSLPTRYLGNDFSSQSSISDKQKLSLQDLQIYNEKCFPPCMRNMFDEMLKQHHLKHFGRLQLGLFLKGAGLSLQDQHKLIQQQFTKKMSMEDYKKKNYQYNINHMYGKEGRKVDYTPKSCNNLLANTSSTEGEHHGCPFAYKSELSLVGLMKRMGVFESSQEMKSIIEKRKNKQYQVACRISYKAIHGNEGLDNIGMHPNAYFEQARAVVFKTEQQPKK